MPEEKVKILWNAVGSKYKVGTLEEFETKLQDDKKRKIFFDAVSQEYNLGDFETFTAKVKKKVGSGASGSGGQSTGKTVAQANPGFDFSKYGGPTAQPTVPQPKDAIAPQVNLKPEKDSTAPYSGQLRSEPSELPPSEEPVVQKTEQQLKEEVAFTPQSFIEKSGQDNVTVAQRVFPNARNPSVDAAKAKEAKAAAQAITAQSQTTEEMREYSKMVGQASNEIAMDNAERVAGKEIQADPKNAKDNAQVDRIRATTKALHPEVVDKLENEGYYALEGAILKSPDLSTGAKEAFKKDAAIIKSHMQNLKILNPYEYKRLMQRTNSGLNFKQEDLYTLLDEVTATGTIKEAQYDIKVMEARIKEADPENIMPSLLKDMAEKGPQLQEMQAQLKEMVETLNEQQRNGAVDQALLVQYEALLPQYTALEQEYEGLSNAVAGMDERTGILAMSQKINELSEKSQEAFHKSEMLIWEFPRVAENFMQKWAANKAYRESPYTTTLKDIDYAVANTATSFLKNAAFIGAKVIGADQLSDDIATSLSYDTWATSDIPVFENGKTNWLRLAPQVAGALTAMVAIYGKGAQLLGTGLRAAGMGAGASSSTGLIGISMVNSVGGYYAEGLKKMQMQDAIAYALTQAMVQSALELVNPNSRFLSLSASTRRGMVAEWSKALARGESFPLKSVFKYLREVGGELTQEELQYLGEVGVKGTTNFVAGQKLVEGDDIDYEEMKTTGYVTVLTTLLGAGGILRTDNSAATKEAYATLAVHYDKFETEYSKMEESGLYAPEDLELFKKTAASYKAAYDSTPKDMSVDTRAKVTPLVVESNRLKEANEDPNLADAFKQANKEKKADIDKKIRDMVYGKQPEPTVSKDGKKSEPVPPDVQKEVRAYAERVVEDGENMTSKEDLAFFNANQELIGEEVTKILEEKENGTYQKTGGKATEAAAPSTESAKADAGTVSSTQDNSNATDGLQQERSDLAESAEVEVGKETPAKEKPAKEKKEKTVKEKVSELEEARKKELDENIAKQDMSKRGGVKKLSVALAAINKKYDNEVRVLEEQAEHEETIEALNNERDKKLNGIKKGASFINDGRIVTVTSSAKDGRYTVKMGDKEMQLTKEDIKYEINAEYNKRIRTAEAKFKQSNTKKNEKVKQEKGRKEGLLTEPTQTEAIEPAAQDKTKRPKPKPLSKAAMAKQETVVKEMGWDNTTQAINSVNKRQGAKGRKSDYQTWAEIPISVRVSVAAERRREKASKEVSNGKADKAIDKVVAAEVLTEPEVAAVEETKKEEGSTATNAEYLKEKVKAAAAGQKPPTRIKKIIDRILTKIRRFMLGLGIISSVAAGGKNLVGLPNINNVIEDTLGKDAANVAKMPIEDIIELIPNVIDKVAGIGSYEDVESTLEVAPEEADSSNTETTKTAFDESVNIAGTVKKEGNTEVRPFILDLSSGEIKVELVDNTHNPKAKAMRDLPNTRGIIGSLHEGTIPFSRATPFQKAQEALIVYDPNTKSLTVKPIGEIKPADQIFQSSEQNTVSVDNLAIEKAGEDFTIKTGLDKENNTAILKTKDGGTFHIGLGDGKMAGKTVNTKNLNNYRASRGGLVIIYSTDGKASAMVSGSVKNIFDAYRKLQETHPDKKFVFFRGDTGTYNTSAFTKNGKTTQSDVRKYSNKNTWGTNKHIVLYDNQADSKAADTTGTKKPNVRRQYVVKGGLIPEDDDRGMQGVLRIHELNEDIDTMEWEIEKTKWDFDFDVKLDGRTPAKFLLENTDVADLFEDSFTDENIESFYKLLQASNKAEAMETLDEVTELKQKFLSMYEEALLDEDVDDEDIEIAESRIKGLNEDLKIIGQLRDALKKVKKYSSKKTRGTFAEKAERKSRIAHLKEQIKLTKKRIENITYNSFSQNQRFNNPTTPNLKYSRVFHALLRTLKKAFPKVNLVMPSRSYWQQILAQANGARFQNENAVFETRDGRAIGFNYDTDKVARERFDLSKMELISSGGSDRDVYDMGDGNVLKIAKSPRGLIQNINEGSDVHAAFLPKVKERGMNYIIAERVTPAITTTESFFYDVVKKNQPSRYDIVNRGTPQVFASFTSKAEAEAFAEDLNRDAAATEYNDEAAAIIQKVTNDFKGFRQRDFDNRNPALVAALTKHGYAPILDLPVLWSDFVALQNWGVDKNGKPIHLDGGTFGGEDMLNYAADLHSPMDDPGFKEVYNRSRRAKLTYGDKDTKTRYLLTPTGETYGMLMDGVIYLNPDHMRLDTPIHEYAHIWLDLARQVNPVLYKNLTDSIKNTPYYQAAIDAYPDLVAQSQSNDKDEAAAGARGLIEEATVQAIADEGVKIVERTTLQKVKAFLKDLWKSVGRALGITSNNPDYMSMTWEDLAQMAAKDLLAGDKITDATSDQVAKLAESAYENNISIEGGVLDLSQGKVLKAMGWSGKRHPDIGSWLQETFQSHGKFKDVHHLQTELSRALTGRFKQMQGTVGRWKVAFGEYNKGLTGDKAARDAAVQDAIDKVNAFLVSKASVAALRAVPKELRGIVQIMRDDIDGLSEQLLAAGYIEADTELHAAISANLGIYMNRSYAAFHDKQWNKLMFPKGAGAKAKKRNRAFENRYRTAFNFVKAQFDNFAEVAGELYLITRDANGNFSGATDAMNVPITDPQLLSQIATAYNKRGKIEDDDVNTVLMDMARADKDKEYDVTGRTIGGLNVNMFKKRDNTLADEIRSFLGEYTAPEVRYAESMMKIGKFIQNREYLTKLKAMGDGKIFFTTPKEGYRKQVPGFSDQWSPLKGLYTSDEIANLLTEQSNTDPGRFMRIYAKANFFIKAGKTVFSPGAQIRNFFSNIGISFSNGYYIPAMYRLLRGTSDIPPPWTYARNEFLGRGGDMLAELANAGAIDSSANGKDLEEITRMAFGEKMKLPLDASEQDVANFFESLPDLLRKSGMAASKAYQWGDNIHKIFNYFAEKQQTKWMFPNLSEAELQQKAGERFRKVNVIYDMAPKVIKSLRRNPILASFPTFAAEIIRITHNIPMLAYSDMKEGLRDRNTNQVLNGLNRLASFGAVVGGAAWFVDIMNSLKGMDDEDEYLLWMANPEYSKANPRYVNSKDGLTYEYIDMGWQNPYSFLEKAYNSFQGYKVEEGYVAGVARSIASLLSPFISPEIGLNTAADAMLNKDRRIWNPESDWDDIAKDVIGYMWDKLKPGVVDSYQKLSKGYRGVEENGRKYDFETEFRAQLSGSKVYHMDMIKKLPQIAQQYREYFDNDLKLYTKEAYKLTNDEAQPAVVQAAYKEANAKYHARQRELIRLVEIMRKKGANDDELMLALKPLKGKYDQRLPGFVLEGYVDDLYLLPRDRK